MALATLPSHSSFAAAVGWREPWPRLLLVVDELTVPGVCVLADLVAGAPPNARTTICCLEHSTSDWARLLSARKVARAPQLQDLTFSVSVDENAAENLTRAVAAAAVELCGGANDSKAETCGSSGGQSRGHPHSAPKLLVIDSLETLLPPQSSARQWQLLQTVLRLAMALPNVRVAVRVSSWMTSPHCEAVMRLADCRVRVTQSGADTRRQGLLAYSTHVTRLRRSSNDAVGPDLRSIAKYHVCESSAGGNWVWHLVQNGVRASAPSQAAAATTATATAAAAPAGSSLDPTAGLLFNLSLTDAQREARSRVPLPYLEAQALLLEIETKKNAGMSSMRHTEDEDDFLDEDFASDDPDEDLEF